MAPRVKDALSRASTQTMLAIVRGYQLTLSPFVGGHCRHVPTCSVYAADAIRRHGPARGAWLTMKRLARCHPWGTAGYDPVPEIEKLG